MVSGISSTLLLSILDLGLRFRLSLHSQIHVASGQQVLSALSYLNPCVLLCSKQEDKGLTRLHFCTKELTIWLEDNQTIPDTLWQKGHEEGCRTETSEERLNTHSELTSWQQGIAGDREITPIAGAGFKVWERPSERLGLLWRVAPGAGNCGVCLECFGGKSVAGMDAIWDTTGFTRLPEQRFSWVEKALLHHGPTTLQR